MRPILICTQSTSPEVFGVKINRPTPIHVLTSKPPDCILAERVILYCAAAHTVHQTVSRTPYYSNALLADELYEKSV